MSVEDFLQIAIFTHVLFCCGILAIVIWTNYQVFCGFVDIRIVNVLARWQIILFTLLWIAGFVVNFVTTKYGIGSSNNVTGLSLKLLYLSVLTPIGLFSYLIGASLLANRTFLSQRQCLVICFSGIVCTANWFLAFIVGSTKELAHFPIVTLFIGYLLLMALSCFAAVMLSASVQNRLNMIRARAAIAKLGISSELNNSALAKLEFTVPTLDDLQISKIDSSLFLSLTKSLDISIVIVKLVIPFFIVSEVLHYLGYIDLVAFLFEPITNLLSLPPSVAIAFAAAFFLNIYAGIAVAAGLSLSPYEWTVVGTFIAICHSIPLEATVMKKVGFPINVHWCLRLALAFIGSWIASVSIPIDLFFSGSETFVSPVYSNFSEMLMAAVIASIKLALKVIALVTVLVIGFDLLRKLPAVNHLMEKHTYLSSLTVGGLLGITYGAGILLKDIESVDEYHKKHLLLFLLLAHGLIEETLIFAFFGADIAAIFLIRVGIAVLAVFIFYIVTKHILVKRSITNE